MDETLDPDVRPATYWTALRGGRPPASDGANRPGVAPGFGDGGYLPDLDAAGGEVEIALVSLESTTGDVTSIRARRVAGGIAYSIVDEYDNAYRVTSPVRPEPLSMGELIELIDTTGSPYGDEGLIASVLRMNIEDGGMDPEDLEGFVTVASDFYPGLEAHYDAWVGAWLRDAAR